ncbi:MAG: SRPBCC family protein [Actinoallomurus sp.]
MSALVSTIEVARRPEEVFAYVTDPTRFPEWQDDVVSVCMTGDEPPAVGTRFTTTRRIGGVDRTMTQEIIRIEPPRAWSAEGVDGPIRPAAGVTIEPLDDGARSRVTFTLDFRGHGVGVPLVPLVRRQARQGAAQSYRSLRELLEGSA